MLWIWILWSAGRLLPAGQAAAGPGPVSQQQASIARQRASIRQQASHLSLWMAPFADPPADPPACEPIADDIVAPLIDNAAKAHAVEPKLIRAVMEQESGLRPCAVSPKGAQGLMQLMPETATELNVPDPFDPSQNIDAGARYLKQLLDRYGGSLARALAAYNAGPNTVDQAGGVPNIPETRGYVESILQKLGIKGESRH